ncbi:VOC family protein [Chitinophaga nivalis]|uniref:VOC family protein n=1 Tax=Chitinophaga nivalis TaxID=2991709 RepID=A0ABT3IE98_9BACT|nr:VOC family protein [Chitinophaga nivalis]MCW3468024.1 VOC family protein [Chitinophaga nivalis]MCW3482285.1 VOC family protein [Chitinophaga nivalis]
MKNFLLSGCFLIIALTGISTNMNGQTKKAYASLNHIALYVVNLERSTAFYRDIIQLEPIPEPFKDGRHSWFKVGAHSQVHLISGAQAAGSHDKNTHLCFSIPDMTAFVAMLQQHRISYEDWPGKPNAITKRVDGVQQIYLKDPDGYWLEINDDTY